MKTVLTEQIDLSEAQLDTEARVLRNVTLIRAGMSKNRRFYSDTVLQAAAPVFEGVKAYDGHKRGSRQVAETTGWYANVRYDNGALKADRHFTRTDAGRNVMVVAEDIVAGRAPATLAGLSINAVGAGSTKKFDDGEALNVESITGATSVDDVDEPAAGGTYLTASNGDELAAKLLAALTFEEWHAVNVEYVKRLQKEWKTMREADGVQAAKAEADHHRTALTEAQERLSALETERDAATSERDAARRDLAIVEALAAAKLPAEWKTDLRETLAKAEPSQWKSIIERERKKAGSAGYAPRVLVSGAGQQVNEGVFFEEQVSPVPRDDEDMVAWMQRTRKR